MKSRTLSRTVLALATVLVLLAGAPAAADVDGIPPVFGGGTGTTGNPGNGTPGTGSTGTPTPAPDGSHWFFDEWAIHPGSGLSGKAIYPFEGGAVEVTWYCDRRDVIAGDEDWLPTSAWVQFGLDDNGNLTTSILRGCTYPGKPVDVPITCASKATVTVTKERGPLGEQLPVTLKTTADTSAWATDRSNVAKCEASVVAAETYIPLRELGGYLVSTEATAHGCSKRVYDDGRAPKVVGCGDPFIRTGTDKAGLYCSEGKVRYDTSTTAWDHGWTWEPCTTEGGLMECAYDRYTPRFNGHPADNEPVGVLDDGIMRPLWFGPLNVKGIIGYPTEVSSRVFGDINKISPRRRDENAFYGLQPFGTAQDGEPGSLDWTLGDTSVWPIGFMAPSNHGQMWSAHKESRFTARVRVTVQVIAQVDIYGNVTHETETRTLTVRSGCASDDANINVSRARSSTGYTG